MLCTICYIPYLFFATTWKPTLTGQWRLYNIWKLECYIPLILGQWQLQPEFAGARIRSYLISTSSWPWLRVGPAPGTNRWTDNNSYWMFCWYMSLRQFQFLRRFPAGALPKFKLFCHAGLRRWPGTKLLPALRVNLGPEALRAAGQGPGPGRRVLRPSWWWWWSGSGIPRDDYQPCLVPIMSPTAGIPPLNLWYGIFSFLQADLLGLAFRAFVPAPGPHLSVYHHHDDMISLKVAGLASTGFMRISVGYGDPARGQVRKLLRGLTIQVLRVIEDRSLQQTIGTTDPVGELYPRRAPPCKRNRQ